MPKTKSIGKAVHSFRISREGVHQLQRMASVMGRSEADVVEIALDRMYREEMRFSRTLREGGTSDNLYGMNKTGEGENESNPGAD